MNDYNVPPTIVYHYYEWPKNDRPSYLCIEHTEPFKVTLVDSDISFIGKKGFNYWLIDDNKVRINKKVFNIYLCYTDSVPRQFY